MTTTAGKTLAIAAAVLLLQGCSTSGIKQDRARKVAQLTEIQVHAAPEAPAPAALDAAYGAPARYRAGDLTLSVYTLDYDAARKLQKASRKAAERARKAAAAGKPKTESMGPGGYALLALMAPIWVPALAFAVPVAAADYAAGSAIVAAEGDDPRDGVTGLGALFVHDAGGNYRWQACCVRSGLVDDKGPDIRKLPYISEPVASSPVAMDYRRDYRALQCQRARAGDVLAQAVLYSDANRSVPDPAWTYYWARSVAAARDPDRPRYLDWVKAALTPESLAEGEAFYRAHPLDGLDCRAMASAFVAAEEVGSAGPRVKAVVSAQG